MVITYCSIITKNEKILLAESTLSESFDPRIKTLLPNIIKKNVYDHIEIEGKLQVTFLRTKKIIFICVSPTSEGDEKVRKFIEQFTSMIISEYESEDNIIPVGNFRRLALQNSLEKKINNFLTSYSTNIYTVHSKSKINEMSQDMEEMKNTLGAAVKKMCNNQEELDEMLLTSKKLVVKAEVYKEEAKEIEYETRCIKPWMLYTMIVLFVLFTVYTAFAVYLCGSLSIFCDRKENFNKFI